MRTVGDILGPDGILARALPSYEPRPAQVEMAERVADALATRRPLLVEAGTGTGKTLAYLVPAVMSGLKVVVSTGTKNLQEQIFRKDVPLLQAELPINFSAACMKGIANYLCLRRYRELDLAERQREALGLGAGPAEARLLDRIRVWAGETDGGDRAELPDLADDAPLWREISATTETRQGMRCPHFDECFVTRARRRAQAADLVIVNHHLFFADLALRTAWPEARLLPAYEAVVFDEAHQLEDVITDYFGVGVSTLRLRALERDVGRALGQGNAPAKVERINEHVARRAAGLFDSLRRRLPERGAMGAETWRGEPAEEALALDTALEELGEALAGTPGYTLNDNGEEADALGRRCQAIRGDLALLVEGAERGGGKHVYWGEQRGRSVFLHASPIDVADIVREKLLGEVDAAVFTSATLTAGGSFDFVRARLGLEAAEEKRLASPFDFASQALLYLPRDLPEPSAPGFTDALADRLEALVEASRGRAFLLFTSHRQLQRVHAILAGRLDLPLLVQGEAPKHLLVEKFKQNRGSVLFATASFWEGVDVVGEALSLVAIDKLPFAPPDDPLVAARGRRLEEAGQDPFLAYHVPRAALALAQGFGRLIRHRHDRGVVAILDRRAVTRGYGRRVLSGLPAECPRTAALDEVRAFFAAPQRGAA